MQFQHKVSQHRRVLRLCHDLNDLQHISVCAPEMDWDCLSAQRDEGGGEGEQDEVRLLCPLFSQVWLESCYIPPHNLSGGGARTEPVTSNGKHRAVGWMKVHALFSPAHNFHRPNLTIFTAYIQYTFGNSLSSFNCNKIECKVIFQKNKIIYFVCLFYFFLFKPGH